MNDRERAWYELHAALPAGWWVGSPSYHNERREWVVMYAFDPSERPKVGIRRREWLAVGDSEEAVVREMARCLGLIKEGKVPK